MKKILVMIALALPMIASAQKFGYIDSQKVLEIMPERAAVEAQIDSILSSYENQYALMQEEFNKKVVDYQQNEKTMTDAMKQFRQQELAEMEQRIQFFQQTIQQEMQRKQQELFTPIYTKLENAIKEVGAEKGFLVIFEEGMMRYIGPDAINVMADVKAKLKIK